jgi:hypothetical protein
MVPRTRRENELRPCEPLEVLNVPVVAPVDPCKEGNWAIVVKMFGSALRSRSAWPRAWVGVGAVKPVDLIREPVTTISEMAVALGASDAGGSAVWALAAPAIPINATALVANKAFKKGDPPRVRRPALILLPPIFR